MVATNNGDMFQSFQHTMQLPDEGPGSSEDGSGLHSPVFGAAYPSTHGDSFRAYPDHSNIEVQYDYPAHSQHLSQGYPAAPFLPPSHSNRHPLPLEFDSRSGQHATQNGNLEWYPPSMERRLPSAPSQEHVYPRPTGNPPTTTTALPPHAEHSTPAQPAQQQPAPPPEPRKPSQVVIACRQCRARKIRCDSTRPVCNNCVRRSNQCEYDAVPKRRGPDKRPGTRQRSCKKRPADGSIPPPAKKKKTNPASDPANTVVQSRIKPENLPDQLRSPIAPRHPSEKHLNPPPPHPYPYHHPHPVPVTELRLPSDPASIMSDPNAANRAYPMGYYDQGSYPKQSSFRPLDGNSFQPLGAPPPRPFDSQKPPALDMSHRQHWDRLAQSPTIPTIVEEMKFLIDGTGHMLSFINIDNLAKRLWQEEHRTSIHPAFIYAALALAKLMKSSTIGENASGLNTAMTYRSEALRSINESRQHRFFDLTLVEAALILAIFESSAHPQFTHEGAASALQDLDELISVMDLPSYDHADPRASRFNNDGVPIIMTPTPHRDGPPRRCDCLSLPGALSSPTSSGSPGVDYHAHGGHGQGPAQGQAVSRQYTPPWDPNWTAEQTRGEEVRRLCWSALDLVSSFLAQCAVDNRTPPKFWISGTSRYALFFPGEVHDQTRSTVSSPTSAGMPSDLTLTPKESIWALYCRSMLLWNYCQRFRDDQLIPSGPQAEDQRAEEVWEAWTEVQAIEDSLDLHKCNLDTGIMYQTREYIHK
ncbi:hypothetical protein CC1G_09257 [Coprinopsis cinerea okayama7|uniref:Zn(2)-C6 fungal-type domain-containing protein n=1 Tax=Coprinopsis cinerea (strain Okayama-7 / 130 / ATCC MYA-4618 / FGSC 9003) TaxID=240176 RepID=A8N836_COPC7|nr:hypothetical protein CC1G_09257 [Coprinopsis cinerea okayama7\|eukprot:XP_001830992.2 hypothetical protein CC1G_09257 [Coprinopsis cinerea okayama7\